MSVSRGMNHATRRAVAMDMDMAGSTEEGAHGSGSSDSFLGFDPLSK